MKPSQRAIIDLCQGLSRRWMWAALAMQDIRLRYRGSVLGPFWMTLTTIVMVTSMGFVYSLIFNMNIATYLPFLTFGLIPWQFISTVVTEGCQTFILAEPIMHQAKMPLTIHVFRIVYRNILVVAHNAIIIVGILLLFQISWGWPTLLLIPACIIIVINAIWIVLILGMISARFRDIPPIIANLMQIIFFLTPIFWAPSSLGEYQYVAEFNPIFAAVDIVRAPLLGVMPSITSWPLILIVTFLGCLGSFTFFSRFRSRVVYWV
jgi:homopolymeric O-antigen transport system permease protein